MTEILSSGLINKTRKQHYCHVCAGLIEAGRPAHSVHIKNSTGSTTIYVHLRCCHIMFGICTRCMKCRNAEGGFDHGYMESKRNTGIECTGVKVMYRKRLQSI